MNAGPLGGRRFYISAAHKSSGKTTVAIGLCAALAGRGLAVQPFKRGPDYIDPMWLGRAAGRACRNLDFHVQSPDEILADCALGSRAADVSVIEGNKGLYDGTERDGSDSNAALAKLLGAPVVLVLDTRGMMRGAAPLILGYQVFDPDVRIAGVILNQVRGHRHESKLRAAVEDYTDLPVLGALHHDPELEIVERHLGLIPSNEDNDAGSRVDAIRRRTEEAIDLDRLLDVAATAAPLPPVAVPPFRSAAVDVRIAVARDSAFGFYYPSDLLALEAAGAELVFVDMIHDTALPPADGLFIGGGFPESRAAALSANGALRAAVRDAVENGLPTYAECGGLMYMSRSLTWNGEIHPMAGVVPADTVMGARPQGRGYIRLKETGNGLWPISGAAEFPAHEFHYSRLENLSPGLTFAWEVLRGHGIDGRNDGIVINNLLAGYGHLRHVAGNPWADRFVAFARTVKHRRTPRNGRARSAAGHA